MQYKQENVFYLFLNGLSFSGGTNPTVTGTESNEVTSKAASISISTERSDMSTTESTISQTEGSDRHSTKSTISQTESNGSPSTRASPTITSPTPPPTTPNGYEDTPKAEEILGNDNLLILITCEEVESLTMASCVRNIHVTPVTQ